MWSFKQVLHPWLSGIVSDNNTRTSKVGAISTAQKAQCFQKQFQDTQRVPFLLDKTRKPLFPELGTKKCFSELSEKSHSFKNCEWGGANIKKNWKGERHLKIFEKKSHSAEKESKGGLFRLVRFLQDTLKSEK